MLIGYFTEHLANFHEYWQTWRARDWAGNVDEWFDEGIWAAMPSFYPGDIALICYAGQWLRARVLGDLISVHGGGPDDYRVTFAWEPQLLNTVFACVPGFTPPEPATAAGELVSAAAGTSP